MNEFGLGDRASRLIESVFERHPNIAEVRVFGSRAKGDFRRESDVDFAIFGDVDSVLASLVASELDDLPLPYQFDVQAYPCIKHAPLREHIDRVGKPFFVRVSSDPR
jgi:predicted nucleotidyltransferase